MSCGYIPIISSVTGPMRAVMGLFQTVTFSALSASSLISGKKAISIRHVYTAGNGVVNICRGAIEAVPIFGNLVCYSYDSCCRPIQYIGQRTDDFALKVRLMSQVEVSIGHTPDLSPIQRLIQRRHS